MKRGWRKLDGGGVFIAPLLLLAALMAGCGQAAPAENAASAEVQKTAAATNAVAGIRPTEIAVTEAAPTKTESGATVATLPLKRGFYVASDEPCGRASNATTLLVTREGINGSHDRCTFKKIEKTGATTYRVTSQCSNGGAAWGREDEIETYTNTYELPNETSFKVTYEGGSERSARYCEQSSLPDPWRDNDISDVTR